jgi:hypothetical protein
MTGRLVFAFVASAALVSASREVRAAEAAQEGIDAPALSPVIREWVGLELTPFSLSLTQGQSEPGEGSSRLQAGPGGSIRLFRHRWQSVYVIPIQIGVYVGGENEVLFGHVQTEGGVVVPGTDRRLELGLGLGVAVLAIKYGNHCDGYCYTGGDGAMISPVARYLFYTTPTATVGASVRALVPLEKPGARLFDGITTWGSALLAGLEVGFGRTGAR